MIEKFEDLKKQFIENGKNFESRFLESHSFNILKEKYQSLNVGKQKLVKYLSIFFILAVLAYFPLSYFFSSAFSWREFKEKQSLSLEMLKMRGKISSSIFRYSQEQLKSKIEGIVKKYSSFDFKIEDQRALFPKGDSIDQIDFKVQLNHLNIKQAIKVGTEMNNLSQARLSSITMEESKKFPKHYDVTYKVSAFVLKERKKDFLPKKPRPSPRFKNTPLKNKNRKTRDSQKDRLKIKENSRLEIEK